MSDLALVPQVDQQAVLQHLQLDPRNPATQATLLICQRYSLDPVLKHVVLISGRPYVTRDGYLHVAHASGQFDGLEVVDAGEDDSNWWAKVSVYRKDMGRPFTYIGRYPKAGANHMAKYGPEMAIKCAEVMALRRAFDIGGIGAADEQWDSTPQAEPAAPEQLTEIADRLGLMTDEDRDAVKAWWKDRRLPALNSGRLSLHDAADVIAHLDDLTVIEGEIVGEVSGPDGRGVVHDDGVEPDNVGEEAPVVDTRASIDRPTPGASQPPAKDGLCSTCGHPEPHEWVEDPNTGDADFYCPDCPDGGCQAPPMSELQSRKLHALLRSVRQATGPKRHVVLTELVGREITSASDLTAAEARDAIDLLTAEEAQA